jgi:hypothetical protein
MENRLRQTVQSIEGTPAEQRMDAGGLSPDLARALVPAAEMLPGSGFVTGVQKGGSEGGLDVLAELIGLAGGAVGTVAGPAGTIGGYALGKGGVKAAAKLAKNIFPKPENIYKTPVYHSTKKAKEIEDADEIYFVSKNNDADIGFHVATTPLAANQRIILNNIRQEYLHTASRKDISEKIKKQQLDELEKKYKGSSNMLLKLKDNINPARVPDVSNFKNPVNWAETIAVSKKDFPDKFDLQQTVAPSYGVDPLIINYKGDKLIVSPKYLQDIMDNEGKINKEYMEDLVKLVYKGKDKVLSKQDKFNPQFYVQDRQEWFEQLKKVNKKHGYDSFIYKNEYEGWDARSAHRFNPKTGKTEIIKNRPERAEDSLMLMYPNQVKYSTASEFNPEKPQLSKKQGGSVVERNPYANYQSKAI